MQDANQLFYQAVQLHLRAERAIVELKAGLQIECFDMLRRVLEVDPHHALAQFSLGNVYLNGEGVETDTVQAVSWYRKAAVQGHTGAQYNLGNMCRKGKGVEKDAVQAASWYRKAAVQGDAGAQCNLGSVYETGEGVEKNAVQAVSWYLKAAVQGIAEAQFNLGLMYAKGKGAQQNLHEAARWWQKAADQGHVGAHYSLGQLNEQQGEYQAAIAHYRAGQVAVSPEEARNSSQRCVVAVVRANQEDQEDQEKEEQAEMKKGGRQVCASVSCAAIIPVADVQICAGCSLVSYCGRSCQKADWKAHKPKCNAEVQARDARDQRGASACAGNLREQEKRR
jgi:TPR repeat protein